MQKKSKQNKEPLVVQYETKKGEYQYARFWDTRSYEDRAERLLLSKIIKKYPNDAPWLVDIGGSFGRLLDVYAERFNQVAIVDYATNEFYLSLEPAKRNNVTLRHIAANAYHLPFADNSQPALISIRVIHHLTEPDKFFDEIYRSLMPGGVAIIEAANKNSLKRLLKCILKLDFSEWRSDWVDIGASGLQSDGSFHLIRNYHPRYLQKLLTESGLDIHSKRTVSWFRRTPITRLPNPIVDAMERFMQVLSSVLFYGPSSWYVVSKPERGERMTSESIDGTLTNPATGKLLTDSAKKKLLKTNKNAKYLELRFPKPRR